MAGNWKKTLDDLLYNGDLDGAYNLLDGILRDNSGDIKARIAFGKVQYELGDPDNARNTFETVLKQSLAHLYPRFLLPPPLPWPSSFICIATDLTLRMFEHWENLSLSLLVAIL